MAYSYVEYTGDGSTTDFTVPFDFLSRSHVSVLLDTVSSDFTWLSDSQVRVSPAPDNGAIVKVKRTTPIDARLVDFQNGSTINADSDMDVDSNQLFFLEQEADDNVTSAFPDPEDGKVLGWDGTDLVNIDPVVISSVASDFVVDAFVNGVGFTAGVSTTLTLSQDPGTKNNCDVYFEGVAQLKSTFSVSLTTLTFTSAIPLGVTNIEVKMAQSGLVGALGNQTVDTAQLVALSVTTGKIAALAVTTGKIADDAVTDAKLRDSTACSVIGRSANSTGNPADISIGSDDTVLMRKANAIVAAKVDTAQMVATAVTPGSYTHSSITVDAAGRVTAASSGTAGLLSGRILLQDQKSTGTNGGALVSTSWNARDLNTEVFDTGNHCTVASNQFTLLAGTYDIDIWCPGYKANRSKVRLYNVSDLAVQTEVKGQSVYDATADSGSITRAKGRFTIAGTKTFRVDHYVANGVASGAGVETSDGSTEVYTEVYIERE
jgi:hypothetical protein